MNQQRSSSHADPKPSSAPQGRGKPAVSLGPILAALSFCSVLFALGAPGRLRAEEAQLLFLPREPVFQRILADPREPQYGIQLNQGDNAFEGSIGTAVELLQWRPGDGSGWGWGILGGAFIALGTADAHSYPLRVANVNGLWVYNSFPERVSDWVLGTYLGFSSGVFSHRLEYVHVSSHLGDELFDYVPRFIYTRESFRFTTSFDPSEQVRLYAGAGYWGHIDPKDEPFFLHAGAELYTGYFGFLFSTCGRGYLAYDLKAKDEAGGVLDQALQVGLQWKGARDSRQAFRLAFLFRDGNSEYGQFYRDKDRHWGVGFFFDP